jgi:hypothetical protein
MTFLEWLFRFYLGEPHSERYWPCPFCEHPTPSVEINEPLDGCAIKWRCHRCNCPFSKAGCGDEYDLVKYMDSVRYPEAKYRVKVFRAEYEEAITAGTVDTPAGAQSVGAGTVGAHAACSSSPRGTGQRSPLNEYFTLRHKLERAGLDPDQEFSRLTALGVGGSYEPAVVEYHRKFREWCRESDDRHKAECKDPKCDTIICRQSRGLPPMTRQELDADRRNLEAAKARKRAEEAALVEEMRKHIRPYAIDKNRRNNGHQS